MLTVRIRRLLLFFALPAAVLIALYALFGFLIVPRLLKSGVQDFVRQHYHREVSLGEVRFNPFTLRLDVRAFSLPDADGQPMVSFNHLLVDLTVASIWRRGPDFQTILLEQPFVRVQIRRDGTLNLGDLALPPEPGTPSSPPAREKPARLFINRFSVVAGNVAFDDQAHPSPFRAEIKPITFDLNNFSTVGRDGGTYDLSGTSEAGERFAWSGSVSAYPLASRGRFEIAELRAQTIWSYLRDSLRFELPSGTISLNGEYALDASGSPPGLVVTVHDIAVKDLGVRPRGGTEDYVKLARLDIHETRADVGKHSVSVGNVHLAGADIHAWTVAPTRINLLELTGPAEAAPAAPPTQSPTAPTQPPSAPPPPPWTVSVPDIALDELTITAEDRLVKPAALFKLEGLNVHVTGFTTAKSTPIAVQLAARINGSGKLEGHAELSPDGSTYKAQGELANLDLTVLQPYIAQRTAMTLRSGLLAAKLQAAGGTDGTLTASGDAELTRFRTVDNALSQDFIKFERLQFAGIDYKSKPASLSIRAINARAPYARVIVESDRTVNVAKILAGPGGAAPGGAEVVSDASVTPAHVPAEKNATPKTAGTKKPAEPPAAAAAKGPDMAIAIHAINVQNGSANYADFWIQPNFAVGIQGLNGYVRGLSSDPASRAKVELQGKVDRYAPVHIWGETNPLAATAFTDIKMNFKGVELTSATPYSGRFAGYKIEKGKLSVDIAYRIENRNLTAQHRMVIDQLELGERVESPDAVKLPLKLAITLLKDRNGVIDLDLPITGTLDDPQFKLGPLIWKVIVNIFEKAVTAPFAALGSLFGGGEEMKYVDFRPGSAVLESTERDKLATLIRALKEKDKLELDVPVTSVPEVDRPALARLRLDRQLEDLSAPAKGAHVKPAASRTSVPAVSADAATGPDSQGAADPALTDPPRRFRLLLDLFKSSAAKDAALPDSVQQAQAALKQRGAPPDLSQANTDLEAVLLQKITVADADLEQLGKARAQAIQDTLLGSGEIDPSRVYVIGTAAPNAKQTDKVRVELALK